MSSATFPASAVVDACREAVAEFESRNSDQDKAAAGRVKCLQTLAEKVVEHANQDFHATVNVDSEEVVLIARFLRFTGAPPMSAVSS